MRQQEKGIVGTSITTEKAAHNIGIVVNGIKAATWSYRGYALPNKKDKKVKKDKKDKKDKKVDLL